MKVYLFLFIFCLCIKDIESLAPSSLFQKPEKQEIIDKVGDHLFPSSQSPKNNNEKNKHNKIHAEKRAEQNIKNKSVFLFVFVLILGSIIFITLLMLNVQLLFVSPFLNGFLMGTIAFAFPALLALIFIPIYKKKLSKTYYEENSQKTVKQNFLFQQTPQHSPPENLKKTPASPTLSPHSDFLTDMTRNKNPQAADQYKQTLTNSMWLTIHNHEENHDLECAYDCLLQWMFLRGIYKLSKNGHPKPFKIKDMIMYIDQNPQLKNNLYENPLLSVQRITKFLKEFIEQNETLPKIENQTMYTEQLKYLLQKQEEDPSFLLIIPWKDKEYDVDQIDINTGTIVITDIDNGEKHHLGFNDFLNKSLSFRRETIIFIENKWTSEKKGDFKKLINVIKKHMNHSRMGQFQVRTTSNDMQNSQASTNYGQAYNVYGINEQNQTILIVDPHDKNNIIKELSFNDIKGRKTTFMPYPSLTSKNSFKKIQTDFDKISQRRKKNKKERKTSNSKGTHFLSDISSWMDIYNRVALIYKNKFNEDLHSNPSNKTYQEQILRKNFLNHLIKNPESNADITQLQKLINPAFSEYNDLHKTDATDNDTKMKFWIDILLEYPIQYKTMFKAYDWHILNKDYSFPSPDKPVDPLTNLEIILSTNFPELKEKFSTNVSFEFLENMETPAEYKDKKISLNKSFWNHELSEDEKLFNVSILIHELLRVNKYSHLQEFIHLLGPNKKNNILHEMNLIKEEIQIIYEIFGKDRFKKLIDIFKDRYDHSGLLQRMTKNNEKLEWDGILESFLLDKEGTSQTETFDNKIKKYLELSINA